MREGLRVRGQRPVRAIVDLAALRANFGEAQRRAGARRVIAVVKADAYGHGAVPVARTLAAAGCRALAVLSVAEAAVLRDAGLALPILVLAGVHDRDEAGTALALELQPVVHDPGQVRWLAEAAGARGGIAQVHVEVDTGMRRMGVPHDEAPALLALVAGEPGLALAGVLTHFARADEPDPDPSLAQLRIFRDVLAKARGRGIAPGLVHVANSAGLLAGTALAGALPEETAVRPGLMLYGANAVPPVAPALQPVMTLVARVVALRAVRAGEGVGYGAEFRAPRDTRVATLSLGYADGIPVSAGGRAHVQWRGRRLPVVGRVSMDYVAVDAGDAPVSVGDEAVVFGGCAGARLPVEEAAAAAGTISYELLVRVGARVPRAYVNAA